jgi:DNA-binding transcriptional MerR regulator
MTALRHGTKSAAAFRTISEVAEDLDVPQHVLRFWETKFSQVRPLKRGGGRRYYRPEDVELLRNIRDLLYTEGYTIKGVQRLLRESGGRVVEESGEGSEGGEGGLTAAQRRELKALKDELMALRDLLKSLKS